MFGIGFVKPLLEALAILVALKLYNGDDPEEKTEGKSANDGPTKQINDKVDKVRSARGVRCFHERSRPTRSR